MKIKINYFLIPLIVLAVSVIGSFLTSSGMDWYDTINLPSFTPPGSVIGAVWTVIFILSAISALIVWNKTKHDNIFRVIVVVFLINAFLNVLWSALYFNQQMIFESLIEIFVLNVTNLALIILIWFRSKAAAILLMPYFGWVSFASYLLFNIWQLNR
ncbi:MAG: TspO/MBR family protein [Patescibacteria group bacterium]